MKQEFTVKITPPKDAEITIKSRVIREKRGGLLIVHEKIKRLEIDDTDMKMDVFRSKSGVNTAPNAVRMTHVPTGISAVCDTKRSVYGNRETAVNMLKVKLYKMEHPEPSEIYNDRQAMFLSVDGVEIGELVYVKPIKGT
jgi:protein subunit release factor B